MQLIERFQSLKMRRQDAIQKLNFGLIVMWERLKGSNLIHALSGKI